jgi:cytochrome c peroxidase
VPGSGGPNYELAASDFPFHKLANEDDKDSTILFDSNDVVGSAGQYNSTFGGVVANWENNTLVGDSTFQVGGVQTRRVTGRNTPSNINAVLNFRNFWDGRANFIFNGASPFGPRDQGARVWIDDYYTDDAGVSHERAMPAMIRIPFASAASQSVGPPGNPTEMSAAGRSFADIGHKLLNTQPLAGQDVSWTDSVLGPYVSYPTGRGLDTSYASYETLIQQAFYPEFWQVPDAVFKASTVDALHPAGSPYRQIEANFSLFWGLAIQMYEETLISDDSPFDRFADGDPTAMTDEQQHGLAIFSSDRGRCVNCHKGAEFTGATSRMILGSGSLGSFGGDGPIELMLMGNSQTGYYDDGFYNIGVTPTSYDIGDGGVDPWGNPLSFPLQLKDLMNGGIAVDSAFVSLDPCTFQAAAGCSPILDSNFREVVDGSFKTPSLRNVELTGPYFHNGGYATLEQVVAFYSRGGNVRAASNGDTSGFGTNPSNLDPDVTNTGFQPDEEAALVAFLKALTDDRVRYQRAPFDHPSLYIADGAVGDNLALTNLVSGKARDQFLLLPAVGAEGLISPILPFTPR